MRKIRSGFKEYNANDLVDLGARVGPQVAGMAIFAGIVPTPDAIALQVTDLRQKMLGTGPGATETVRAAMLTLATSLSTLATNVMETPGVTEADLAATEFPMAKEVQRTTTVPPAPANLRLRHGAISGQILGRCDTLGDNIKTYEIQWTLDPNAGPWTDGEPTTSSLRLKFDGLPRGTDIWVRVRARNVVGAGAWSDPATIMVV